MMQASASTTRLRGGGPYLENGTQDHVMYRVAATSGSSGRPGGIAAKLSPDH
jgi:hypothetical protein